MEEIPVTAERIDNDVYIDIYSKGMIVHRTKGILYKIKTERLDENTKRDYYIQEDRETKDLIVFAVNLQRGLDITSKLSKIKKLVIDVSFATRDLLFVLAIQTLLLIYLASMLFLPQEYTNVMVQYFNITTISGYIVALILGTLWLYKDSIGTIALFGQFRIIGTEEKAFRIRIDRKIISFHRKVIHITQCKCDCLEG